MKDKEWSGLLKIPNEVIIKELRIELGQINSIIDELKYEIVEFQNINKSLLLNGFKQASEIVRLQAEIEKLNSEIKRQQKANTKLHRSLYKLKHLKQ